uniref:Cdc42 effector protein 3-like isoform X1 n=2 Tax=Petromyzon marinus TaxID=7757 RepID=A0AAJ7T7B4_PETMA|nr:cdc42 effector protein 3-like isoform X1 [Petromyzon marinus]
MPCPSSPPVITRSPLLRECGCLRLGERLRHRELRPRPRLQATAQFERTSRRLEGSSSACPPGEVASGAAMPVGKPIYLKTPLSKRGRKVHLRDILTPEMISSPMGELRHLAHIGRAGKADMFGDLTFLQGRFDLVPDFRGRLSTASEGYMDGREADLSADQPMLKTAVSLPALIEPQALPREHEEHSGSVSVGSKGALMVAPPKPPRLYLDQAADEDDVKSNRNTEDKEDGSASIGCESVYHATSQDLDSLPTNGTMNSSRQVSHGTSVSNGHNVGTERLSESQDSDVESELPEKNAALRSSGYGHVANGGLTNGLGFPWEAHRNAEAAPRMDRQQISPRASEGRKGNVHPLAISSTNHRDGQEVTKPRSGSLISLQLDLGPSMLEDILSVMEDKNEDASFNRQRPKTYIM